MKSINRRVMESLVKAGAMDSFQGDSLEGSRPQLLLALDGAIESGIRAARDKEDGQSGLFGMFLSEDHPEPTLPRANDWTQKEKLQGEKELLGFYVSGHPSTLMKTRSANSPRTIHRPSKASKKAPKSPSAA